MLSLEYKPLRELIPYARNAKRHPATQIAKIKSSLTEFGWANPMLIADGQMVAGHGRLQAALEMAEAGQRIPRNPDPWVGPTVDLGHLSDAQRRLYVVMDNRSAEDGSWDNDLLRIEFEELKIDGADLSLSGFEPTEIDNIFSGWEPDFGKIDKVPSELTDIMATIKVKCRPESVDILKQAIEKVVMAAGIPDVEIDT